MSTTYKQIGGNCNMPCYYGNQDIFDFLCRLANGTNSRCVCFWEWIIIDQEIDRHFCRSAAKRQAKIVHKSVQIFKQLCVRVSFFSQSFGSGLFCNRVKYLKNLRLRNVCGWIRI